MANIDTDNVGRQTMKPCADESLDKALYTWFSQERNRGTPLSGPILKEKALWFHKQLNSKKNALISRRYSLSKLHKNGCI